MLLKCLSHCAVPNTGHMMLQVALAAFFPCRLVPTMWLFSVLVHMSVYFDKVYTKPFINGAK